MEERPPIRITGLHGRGGVTAAVVVLERARATDLRKASSLAGMLADRCLLVAVDGGLKTCRAARRRPDLFAGDGDSSGRVPRGIPSAVFPVDKDYSDLAGALRELRRRKIRLVLVAGLLGGRLDHEWANLLELARHARHFAGVIAATARGLVVIPSRGCRAPTVPGRTVSLFALVGPATVSLRGTRWPLTRRRIPPGSLGLSNVTGTSLHLTVHQGSAALVFPSL